MQFSPGPVQSTADLTLFSTICFFSNPLCIEHKYHVNQADITHLPVRSLPLPLSKVTLSWAATTLPPHFLQP